MAILKKIVLSIVLLHHIFIFHTSFGQVDTLSTASKIDTLRTPTPSTIGFRLGFTLNRFSIANADESDKNGIGAGFPLLSGFYNYQINPKWSVQTELGLMRYRSYNTLYKIANLTGTVDYSVEAIEGAILGVYTYPLPNAKFTIRGEFGTGVGYVWNATGTVRALNLELGTLYTINTLSQFKHINVGALLGVSAQYHLKHVYLIGSMRYRQGLMDLNDYDPTANRYLAYGEKRILPQNLVFQFGLGIPIVKKSVSSKQ